MTGFGWELAEPIGVVRESLSLSSTIRQILACMPNFFSSAPLMHTSCPGAMLGRGNLPPHRDLRRSRFSEFRKEEGCRRGAGQG